MPRASGRQRRSGGRGRWRRAGRQRQPGAGGRGVALRGRAEPRAPWPAAEEAARRRPALLGQRPPHCAPGAASQRRGTETSMRLPARPANFEVYPLPPSLPPSPPSSPAVGGRWAIQPPRWEQLPAGSQRGAGRALSPGGRLGPFSPPHSRNFLGAPPAPMATRMCPPPPPGRGEGINWRN